MLKEYKKHSESQRIIKRKYPTLDRFERSLLQSAMESRSHSNYWRVLNHILSYADLDEIKLFKRDIARALGISMSTVSRSINHLRKRLFFWTILTHDPVRDDRNDALVFELPEYFLDPGFRNRMFSLLPACALPLTWSLSVLINAAGVPLRESDMGFSLRYIREEKTESKIKKKRQPCIIRPTIFIKNDSNLPQTTTDSTTINQLHCVLGCCDGSNNNQPEFKKEPEAKKGTTMSNRRMVDEVLKYITLNEEQLFQLDQYNDNQLQKALSIVQRKGHIEKPDAYFLSTLRNIHQQGVTNKKWVSHNNTKPAPQQAIVPLNERYDTAEIAHLEKLLEKFAKICVEDPAEADNIANRRPSSRWSLSWSIPDIIEQRLKRLRRE